MIGLTVFAGAGPAGKGLLPSSGRGGMAGGWIR